MAMAISFEKIKSKIRLMNPQKGYSLEEIPFEIRFDPLTGQTGRVFNLQYNPPGPPDISGLIQQSKEIFCPFCPETIEKSTPLFPKEVIPEGRIKLGEACLVPNILPLDKYTGVSIMSHEHYIPMEDFTPEKMKDAFLSVQVFIKRIAELDSEVNFFSINWNYMPQAGSSMIHPHLHVICGEFPTNHLRMQIEGSRKYYEENGSNFWEDFIKAEKDYGDRFIGEIGPTFWAMSYVPQGFLPDAWCIFHEQESLIHVGEETLMAFLQGLSKVLRYFTTENIFSFNVSIFSVREDKNFRVNARILPRLLLRAIGNSDYTYYQTIHKEPCAVRPPETVCKKVKEFFRG